MYDRWEKIFPGIWKQTIGKPQRTLTGIAGSSPVPALQEKSDAPFPAQISCDALGAYTVLRIALLEDEQVFGGGLLFHRTISDHQVYHLRADHYSGTDSGRTHVPTPFIAISNGIGIFCNTPKAIDLYVRTCQRRTDKSAVQEHDRVTDPDWRCYNTPYFVEIAVPGGEAEFILFAGENLKDCVSRFNLFCGGGFIPPKWGLGLWHRTNMTMDSAAVRQLVLDYQQHGFPLSVIGLAKLCLPLQL